MMMTYYTDNSSTLDSIPFHLYITKSCNVYTHISYMLQKQHNTNSNLRLHHAKRETIK